MSEARNSTCPLCLENNLLSVPILSQSQNAYLIDAVTAPGNFLIIPKHHVEAASELADTWWYELKQVLPSIDRLDDYNISINLGKNSGQKLKHLHFWVIPRHEGKASSGKGLAALISEIDKTTS